MVPVMYFHFTTEELQHNRISVYPRGFMGIRYFYNTVFLMSGTFLFL